jgi:uncharacterized SAM-binding protein YcdF (DUF218 family)
MVGAAGVVAFLVITFTPATSVLDRWLAIPARLEPADALIVLAAGLDSDGVLSNSSMRRALRGITLYKKGLAPLLVLSGSPAPAGGRPEAQVRADLARELGVPPAALILLGTARATREEALEFGRLLRPRGVRRILLVTDGDHMPRAFPLFERAGFEVFPAPVHDTVYDAAGPEDRLSTSRSTLMELAARLYYRAAGYL